MYNIHLERGHLRIKTNKTEISKKVYNYRASSTITKKYPSQQQIERKYINESQSDIVFLVKVYSVIPLHFIRRKMLMNAQSTNEFMNYRKV